MIGYKATDKDGCCKGFKFEVGKTYIKNTSKEELKCCTDKVFHFCRELFAIEKESNYKLSESRLFEVIAGDCVRSGDKYGTNSLTIIREIEGEEKLELINSGNRNSGDWNSGNYNSGNRNSGNRNSGNRNSGDCNSGDYNTGDYNTGNYNSGFCNSGNLNSGDWNSGDYNSGNRNSGFFNSNEPNVRMFNKDTKLKKDDINIPSWCYFNLTVWVSHDTATEEDKEVHKKEIETCGGFLKTLEYKEAWKLAYDKTNDKEKIQLFNLPNFDVDIFKEISGIDVRADYKKLIEVEIIDAYSDYGKNDGGDLSESEAKDLRSKILKPRLTYSSCR